MGFRRARSIAERDTQILSRSLRNRIALLAFSEIVFRERNGGEACLNRLRHSICHRFCHRFNRPSGEGSGRTQVRTRAVDAMTRKRGGDEFN
jgi:hypothetical protein